MSDHGHLNFNIKDEYNVWGRISETFKSRLPLRNLIWKGGIVATSRFVEELNIKIADFDSSDTSRDALSVSPVQHSSLLNIYLVESDSDTDTYKSVTKPKIKNWVDKVSQRKGEDWLVVYLPSESELSRPAAKFLAMRTSIFDKVKSDFETSKKKETEHVMRLNPSSVESWNALFLSIRDRVVQALEERVAVLSEDIRRMDANRMLPGWNYCKFFILKEGLVDLYRLMGMHEEALAQYDELEAAFFQLLESHSLSWFSKFGGGEQGDDFTDLLDLHKKPYRKQMIENTISMFDFRLYLFGRQCELLMALERYAEFVERVQRFIPSFAKSMRNPGTGLSLEFIISWTYSTCQNVVEICEGIQLSQTPYDRGHIKVNVASANRMLSAAKAEFLTSARQQLDLLGTIYDCLPPSYLRGSNTYHHIPPLLLHTPAGPADGDAPQGPAANKEGAGKSKRRESVNTQLQQLKQHTGSETQITNPVLTESLSSIERFDQIYIKTCEQATQYYVECGRRRFSLVLQGDIAHLHMCRSRWHEAATILRRLIGDGVNSRAAQRSLSIMDAHLIERLAQCERELGNARECITLLLQLLSDSLFLDAGTRSQYADKAIELSASLDSQYTISDLPVFVPGGVQTHSSEESLCIELDVESAMPYAVTMDSVSATLASSGGGQFEVEFSAQDVVIAHGANTVVLRNDKISCPGVYTATGVDLVLGKTTFRHSLAQHPAEAAASRLAVVRLREHPTNALVEVGEPQVVDVKCTGGDGGTIGVFSVNVRVESRSERIAAMSMRLFATLGGAADGTGSGRIEKTLEIEPLEPHRTASMTVRFDESPPVCVYSSATVSVVAEYRGGEAAASKIFMDTFPVHAPPLLVTADLHLLRTKCALQVQARCVAQANGVRISRFEAQPDTPANQQLLGGRAAASRGLLQCGEAVTNVYNVARTSAVAHTVSVAYTTLLDGLQAAVDGQTARAAREAGVAGHARWLRKLVRWHLRSSLDTEATLRTGRLVFGPLAALSKTAAAGSRSPAAIGRALAALDKGLRQIEVAREDAPQHAADRRVRMAFSQQVDEEFADVRVALDTKRCTVFEPVRMQVSVTLDGTGPPEGTARIWIEVLCGSDDALDCWVVSGATTSAVDVGRDAAAAVEVVLVPLRVGYLKLPGIACYGEEWKRLPSWVSYDQTSACVVSNEKIPSVYTVPVGAES